MRDILGKRAVILGHHYQRADVYKHADLTGDSLRLSKLAAQTDAEYIVFCGVHFMAEVADVLSKPEQVAILPDLNAGCSMADMANLAILIGIVTVDDVVDVIEEEHEEDMLKLGGVREDDFYEAVAGAFLSAELEEYYELHFLQFTQFTKAAYRSDNADGKQLAKFLKADNC